MHHKSQNGLTLIETMIASAILLMMLTAIYQTLVLGLRFYDKTRDAAEIQQEGLRVVAQLERSIQSANSASLEVFPAPLPSPADPSMPALGFVSAETNNGFFQSNAAGAPTWQKSVLFYCQPKSPGLFKLFRSEIPILPATPTAPPLPAVGSFFSGPSQTMLSESVSGVQFGDSSSVLITVSLISPRKNGITITSRAIARN
jgi:prepilin-type N-terminal cleavage/methylation domain-containing protein